MKLQTFPELKPKVVLGVAAHPDDLDFGAAGSMAVFASSGAKIHYLILTDGGKGTADKKLSSKELTQQRQKEQQAALDAVGGQSITFLEYPDGYLEVTMDLKKDICKVIRAVKPDLVVTMDPSSIYSAERGFINHPDHRAAGQATLDAVYPLARDHLSFPDLYEGGLMPHVTKTVLLNNFDQHNFVIDISNTFDKKIAALKAHASQVGDIKEIEGWLRKMSSDIGKSAGYSLGEAFIRIDVRP